MINSTRSAISLSHSMTKKILFNPIAWKKALLELEDISDTLTDEQR